MQESEILLAQPVADPEGTKSGHGFLSSLDKDFPLQRRINVRYWETINWPSLPECLDPPFCSTDHKVNSFLQPAVILQMPDI